MSVGTVADVLEHVLLLGERRETDPAGALAAHLRQPAHAAVHPHRHRVAADAAAGDVRPLGKLGRRVVGTAAAEVGRARQCGRQLRGHLGGLGAGLQVGQPLGRYGARQPLLEVGAEDPRHVVAFEFPVHREQRLAGGRLLAADQRPVGQVVEDLADLGFDETALVLDDDDLLEALGELAQAPRLDRRDASELEHPDAMAVERGFVQPEQFERQTQVAVGLAGRDQADAVAGAGATDAVEAVGVDVGQSGRGAFGEDLPLELDRVGRQQPHVELLLELAAAYLQIGQDGRCCPRQVDDRAAVGDVGHDLEPGPQAGIPGQRDPVQPELQHLRRIARVEHRDREVEEADRAVAGDRRALAGGVVAGEDEDAAVLARADEVAVTEGVAGAVDAGRLAVPDADYAVEALVRKTFQELGAVDRGRRRLLVDRRSADHVVIRQQPVRSLKLFVVLAQRRSGIAADEGANPQAGFPVAAVLVHR